MNFVPSPPQDRLAAAPGPAALHPDVGTQRRWEKAKPDLVDAWRQSHPSRCAYNYVVPRHASRLDRFYVSARLMPQVAGCTIGQLSVGDHRPISLTLAGLCPSAPGPHRPRVGVGFPTSAPLVQELQAWLEQELVAAPTDHLACCRLAQGASQAGNVLADLHARLDSGDDSVPPAAVCSFPGCRRGGVGAPLPARLGAFFQAAWARPPAASSCSSRSGRSPPCAALGGRLLGGRFSAQFATVPASNRRCCRCWPPAP